MPAKFEVRNFTTSCPGELMQSINSNVSITQSCLEIVTRGKKTFFIFDGSLSNDEKTELNSMLSSWACPSVSASSITGIDNVQSEPMSFSYDSVREKYLSNETSTFIYSENKIANMDWINIGGATNAESGIIMPYKGTVIRATGNCRNVANRTAHIHLFINTLSIGSILSFSGTGAQNSSSLNLNVDFDAGDRIRVRGITTGNTNDVVIALWIKWRRT